MNIGIFRSDGLGDWFLTLPLITELLTRTDTSSVTLMGPRVTEIKGIISDLEYLQIGVKGPAPGNTLLQRVRNVLLRLGFSSLSSFFCILRSKIKIDVLVLPRGRETWGFGHQGVIWALRMLNPRLSILQPKLSKASSIHEKDTALSCIENRASNSLLSANAVDSNTSLKCTILLHGGAGALNRRWPASNWQKLKIMIEQDKSITVDQLYPISTKKNVSPDIAIEAKGTSYALSTVQQLSDKIQASQLVVCTDSLVSHIASWHNIPVVVISPHPLSGNPMHMNSPERFGPWSSNSIVIRPPDGLDDCLSHCKVRKSHCIATILPKDVYSQVLFMMKKIQVLER